MATKLLAGLPRLLVYATFPVSRGFTTLGWDCVIVVCSFHKHIFGWLGDSVNSSSVPVPLEIISIRRNTMQK